MKQIARKLSFKILKFISKFKVESIAHKIINFGYLLLSERHFYKNGAVVKDILRHPFHTYFSTIEHPPTLAIDYFEFGVLKGDFITTWAENNKNKDSYFVGFDTFTGLPEDWGSIPAGAFSANGILPDVKGDTRVEFVVGLIQDTLPVFLNKYQRTDNKKLIVHIDVDLYNATLITLIQLNHLFRAGDIIIFDDFFTLTKTEHEFKAYLDYLSLYKRDVKSLYNVYHEQYVLEFI